MKKLALPGELKMILCSKCLFAVWLRDEAWTVWFVIVSLGYLLRVSFISLRNVITHNRLFHLEQSNVVR